MKTIGQGMKRPIRKLPEPRLYADDFNRVSKQERILRAYQADSIDGFILKPNQWAPSPRQWMPLLFAQEHKLSPLHRAVPAG
jgi:hypothetical protein